MNKNNSYYVNFWKEKTPSPELKNKHFLGFMGKKPVHAKVIKIEGDKVYLQKFEMELVQKPGIRSNPDGSTSPICAIWKRTNKKLDVVVVFQAKLIPTLNNQKYRLVAYGPDRFYFESDEEYHSIMPKFF